jgi:ornithine cyclodeaminase/alanine dehydrogenase
MTRTDRDAVLLTDDMLAGLGISTAEAADSVEAALANQEGGSLLTAPKSAIVPGDGRYMMTTLSVADLTVVKSVMVSPRNPDRGLDGIEGNILIQDSETGLLRAVMGAKWVTAVRTAALSTVAARRLADPESGIIAFVGCGTQAHSHLDAFADLFPLKAVRAVGRGQAGIDRLCEAARARGLAAEACSDPRDAFADADIIVTSITLSYDVEPFLDAGWMKPGAFAAITDLALPWRPEGMSGLGTLYIDDLEQEAASPKPMVDPQLISGDLRGLAKRPRASAFAADTRSAFVFRGLAIGDYALAALAYDRAVKAGIGTRITL